MGEDKVWLHLAGLPVLAYSLRAFAASPAVSQIVLVVSPGNLTRASGLLASLEIEAQIREGGDRRQDSVRSGLEAVADATVVAIHDGARPFVSRRLIDDCYRAAEESGAAISAIPVRDTLKRASTDGWVEGTVDRSALWAAQTPQAFRTALLRRAYESVEGEITDEAVAVERLGYRVRIVHGDPSNLKLTSREDLALAEALVQRWPS